LQFLAASLSRGFEAEAMHSNGGFEAMLSLFDSTITFHAQYQQSRDLAALLDLLVLDGDNPRSLAWVAHTLRGRLAKLAGSAPDALSPLARKVPDPSAWSLAQLCELPSDNPVLGVPAALHDMLQQCLRATLHVSDEVSATYFTHASDNKHSVGTP
jgi:uncharacterized alpha-E superfamily protein